MFISQNCSVIPQFVSSSHPYKIACLVKTYKKENSPLLPML